MNKYWEEGRGICNFIINSKVYELKKLTETNG